MDNKKDEFRKYLDKDGVIDALTQALMNLYEEQDKPSNALEYLRKALGQEEKGSQDELEQLKVENSELKAKIAQLEQQLNQN